MRYTPKLELKLPESSDPSKISDISENFEKLDDLGAGVEAVKNGTGPGSLFLVSKYYKEPVKDALLCNGGYASVAQYPELYEVLGSSYGSQWGVTNVSSQYGVSAANGYPIAYNAKHDCFCRTTQTGSAVNLVIYRRGASPLTVGVAGSSETATGYVFTAGDFVFGWVASSGSKSRFLFDLTTNTRITTKDTVLNKLLDTDYAKDGARLAFTKNYILSVAYFSSGTYGGFRVVAAVRLSDFTLDSEYIKITGVTDSTSTVPYSIINYDTAATNDDFYFYTYQSSAIKIYRGTMESGAAEIAVVLVGTVSGSEGPRGCSIIGGYFVQAYSTSSYVNFYSAQLSGSTTTTAKKTQLSITDYTQGTYRTNGMSEIRSAINVGGGWILFLSGHRDAIYFANNIATRVPSLTGGNVEMISPSVPSGKVCTLSGVYDNPKVSTFKLPSISLSESLVYMRTKGA